MGYSVNDTYPAGGDWLGADDFKRQDGTYGSTTATIERIEMQQVDRSKTDPTKVSKLELHFTGRDKTLLLNKTNAGNIAMAYGDNTDNWIGKQIGLSVHSTNFGPGILVSVISSQPGSVVEQPVQQPAMPAQQPAVDFGEDVPF